MTVNERLFATGLLEAFDRAARRRDRQALLRLLQQAFLPAEAAQRTVDALLADPEKHGY